MKKCTKTSKWWDGDYVEEIKSSDWNDVVVLRISVWDFKPHLRNPIIEQRFDFFIYFQVAYAKTEQRTLRSMNSATNLFNLS